jgi:cyclic pyranopterin phosphate synthase
MTVADMTVSKASDYFEEIKPDIKQRARITPFLTFPLLKACNMFCNYCGEGGELSASMLSQWNYEELIERIYIAHSLGVRKIRITGGEPFLHKHIVPILETLNDLGCYAHINTNGTFIQDHEEVIAKLNSNMHFAVSLDTLNEDKFYLISQTKKKFDYYNKTKTGIHILKKYNRLLRINMVVTTDNIDEVFDMIDFCSEVGCHLKLLDVVSVPLPFGNRQDLHVSFSELENKLREVADFIENHQYARAFGTPCKIYVVNNVRVTTKNTWNGSRYEVDGICKNCEYFPCHEGLYDIFALPDGRVVGCRWSDSSVAATNDNHHRYEPEGDFKAALLQMSDIFRRATYLPRRANEAMKPHPFFVTHSLETAKTSKNQRSEITQLLKRQRENSPATSSIDLADIPIIDHLE